LRRKGASITTRRGCTALLLRRTELREGRPLVGASGHRIATRQRRELLIQGYPELCLHHPVPGRVRPAALLRSQLMAATHCRQGFFELLLLPENVPKITPGHGVVRI